METFTACTSLESLALQSFDVGNTVTDQFGPAIYGNNAHNVHTGPAELI